MIRDKLILKYRLNEPDGTMIFVPFIVLGIFRGLCGIGEIIANVLK